MADQEMITTGHRLSDLRRLKELTQHQLASLMGVRQPRVSQLEGADLGRMELATLRAYVAALGGRLRVVAEFDDDELMLTCHPPEVVPAEPAGESQAHGQAPRQAPVQAPVQAHSGRELVSEVRVGRRRAGIR